MTKYLNPNNYIKFMLNKIQTLLSPIIRMWENRYIKKYSMPPLKHQPVFIIGAPRTGSTILYQTLTNQLDVLYVDNLVCRFNKNFFFGFWISNKIFKQQAHNCFKSNHGNTSKCGLGAPSECGNFWYRWLPTDRDFIDYEDIDDNMVKEIRDEITAVINYFDKPLVFKNLNAGQRLKLLNKCFPYAKFIFIQREPLFTAQSILKAKRKLGIADNIFWSIRPKNYHELEQLNPYEQIVKQIFYIEQQIEKDKKIFNKESFLCINYKDLGKKFNYTLDICERFVKAKNRKIFEQAEIQLTENLTLDQVEIDKLNYEINKLNWDVYSEK